MIKNIFSILILFALSLFISYSYCQPDDDENTMIDDPNKLNKDRNTSELEQKAKDESYTDTKGAKKGDVYEAYGIPKPDNKAVSTETENDGKENEADKNSGKSESDQKETFRINKDEFTKEQIIGKATEHFGFDVSKLPATVQQKQIDAFIAYENRKAASDSFNQRNHDLAKQRKEYESERDQFLSEKDDEWKRIQSENKKLATREAELKQKAEIDLSGIYDEDDKEKAREEKFEAKSELKDIAKEKATLKAAAERIESDVTESNLKDMVNRLQSQYPELVTSREITDVIMDYESDKEVDMDQVTRAEAVRDIISDYLELYADSEKKPSIEKYYKAKYLKYNVPAPIAKNGNGTDRPTTLASEKARIEAERIKKQAEEQKKSPIEIINTPGDYSTMNDNRQVLEGARKMGY